LVASPFTCAQIFTVTIAADSLHPGNASACFVDLGGTHRFGFEAQCRSLDDGACATFLGTLDESGLVVLEFDSLFQDNSCDMDFFSVTFDANLTFHADDQFSDAVNESASFVIGDDTIFGKIVVGTLTDSGGEEYEFLNVSIEAVFVCTASSDLAARSISDSVDELDGCFSALIDADGPYKIIGTGSDGQYRGTTAFEVDASNEARFSFLAFDTPRTTITVHVQLLLTLTNGARRRMLLDGTAVGSANGNAFVDYIGTVALREAPRREMTSTTNIEPIAFNAASPSSTGYVSAIAMFLFCAGIVG